MRCVFPKCKKKKTHLLKKKRTFFLGIYYCKFEKGAFFFLKVRFFQYLRKKLPIFEIISPDQRVLNNFFLKYWKKTHLFQKKTHPYQIYDSISLKKRCVFFFRKCTFFFYKDFGKTHLLKKTHPFFRNILLPRYHNSRFWKIVFYFFFDVLKPRSVLFYTEDF